MSSLRARAAAIIGNLARPSSQFRHDASERQVHDAEVAIVHGNAGVSAGDVTCSDGAAMSEMQPVDSLAPYAAWYWGAARRGKIVVQQCDTSGRSQRYPSNPRKQPCRWAETSQLAASTSGGSSVVLR